MTITPGEWKKPPPLHRFGESGLVCGACGSERIAADPLESSLWALRCEECGATCRASIVCYGGGGGGGGTKENA